MTPIDQNPTTVARSFGLLAVAAAALLALGLAALANTLRRTDDEDDLAAMAWSDGLTGVANRRRLDRDIAAQHRRRRSDRRDHGRRRSLQAGQRHVRAPGRRRGVARSRRRALGNQVRHDDVVYRYGGEEFCILLPGASHGEAPA